MAWQLIYTSAPRLLDAGRSGFGTVARPRQMRALLTAAVERVSQFNRMPGFDEARIIYSHRHITIGGTRYSVLTRIRSAGADYTKRTNHIAHHIIVEQREIAALGPNGPTPVDVLLSADWRDRWDEPPSYLEDELPIARIPRRCALPAQCWEGMTGSRRRAALLTAPDAVRGCYIAWENDPTVDPYQTAPLCLFGESLLLRPDRAWDTTFTTNLQPSDEPSDFHWRGMLADSPLRPQAEQSGRPMFNVVAHSLMDTPTGELADLAELGVRKVTPQHFAVQQAPLPAPHEEYTQAPAQAAEPGYEAMSRLQTASPQPRQQPKQNKQEPHKRSKWRALLIPGLAITAILIIVSACIFWSHKKQQEKRDAIAGNLATILEGLPPFKDPTRPIGFIELKRQLLERNEAIGIEELEAFCNNAIILSGIWKKTEAGLNDDDATAQQALGSFRKRGNIKPADRMDRWAEILAARLKVCAAIKDKDAAVKYLQEHGQEQAEQLEAFAHAYSDLSDAWGKFQENGKFPETDTGKLKAAIRDLEEQKFELPPTLKKVKDTLFTQKMDPLQASPVTPARPTVAAPTPAPTPTPVPASDPVRLFPCRTFILATNREIGSVEMPVEVNEQFALSLFKDFDRNAKPTNLLRHENAFRITMTQEAPALELVGNTRLAAGNGAPQYSYILIGPNSDAPKFQVYVFNRPTSAKDTPLLPSVQNGFQMTNQPSVFGLKPLLQSLDELWLVGNQKLYVYADATQQNAKFDFSKRQLDFSRETLRLKGELEKCQTSVSELKAQAEKLTADIAAVKSNSQARLPQFGNLLMGISDPKDKLLGFDPGTKEAKENLFRAFQGYLAELLARIKTQVKDDDQHTMFGASTSTELEARGKEFQDKLKELHDKFEKASKATDKKTQAAAQANLNAINRYQKGWTDLRAGIPEPVLTNLIAPDRFVATATAQLAQNTKAREDWERSLKAFFANPLLRGRIPPGAYRIVIEEQGEQYRCIPLIEITQTSDSE